jgi:hypothetical protein
MHGATPAFLGTRTVLSPVEDAGLGSRDVAARSASRFRSDLKRRLERVHDMQRRDA